MKRILAALLLFAGCAAARGANSYTFTVTATLTFSAANPSTVPSVPGNAPVIAQILIVNPNRENFHITVQAQGANLSSGTDNIAVGNLTWSATAAFVLGCSNPPCTIKNAESITATAGSHAVTTSPVTTATGYDGRASTATDTYTGTVTHTFLLANSWLYTTGNYTQSLLFTFSSP